MLARTGLWVSVWMYVFMSLRFTPRNRVDGSQARSTLTFHGTAGLFSRAATPYHIPISIVWGFYILHILASACYHLSVRLQSGQWVWGSVWGSNLRFLEPLTLCTPPIRSHSVCGPLPQVGLPQGCCFARKRASCILGISSERTEVTSVTQLNRGYFCDTVTNRNLRR